MIRVGVIGYGYWGPNLVRNFHEVMDCEVVAVSDTRAERRALVRRAIQPSLPRLTTAICSTTRSSTPCLSPRRYIRITLALRSHEQGKHVDRKADDHDV